MDRATLFVFLLSVALTVGLPPKALIASTSYQVVHGWPTLPEGFAFGQVAGVGVDSHNHVFVFHRGDHPIMCIGGATGEIIKFWGDGFFDIPHGLAVDSKDNVWVTDVGLHQVFKFSHEGELLMTLGEKGVTGLDDAHFNKPTDVAITPSGDFYVSDGYGNSRVVKFSPKGKFLFDWGKKGDLPGEFDLPHGIALDPQGRVYVADRTNSRVQVFDETGNFLAEWKSAGIGRPWDVAVGPDGFVYIMDGGDMNPKPPDRGRVVRVDLQGKKVDQFGSFGSYDGQFYWGHAVAVAPEGAVYVADVHLGMRAQKFVKSKRE